MRFFRPKRKRCETSEKSRAPMSMAKSKIEKIVCKNCNQSFAHRSIRVHYQRCTSDGTKNFHCTVGDCKAAFITKNSLSSHVHGVHSPLIKCPFANCTSYMKMRSMHEHLRRFHEELTELCKNCEKRVLDWDQHFDHSPEGMRFHCVAEHCKSQFTNASDLKTHVMIQHSRAPIKCPHENCNVFMKPQSLRRHVKIIHEQMRETCHNCRKRVPVGSLEIHRETCVVDETKNHRCTIEDCKASFKTKKGLTKHRNSVHTPTVKCPFENCFAHMKPNYVDIHIRMVHRKMRWTCEKCEKTMVYRSLKAHLKVCKQKVLEKIPFKQETESTEEDVR